METGKIYTGIFTAEEIKINPAELSRRLGVPKGFEDGTVNKCTKLVADTVSPRYCYAVTEVDLSEKDMVNLGFVKIHSADLYKNLTGCRYAYIMAVTIGMDADRLVSKLAVTSGAESFIADGISSAFAESVIDKLSDMLSEEHSLKPRFSPGYGDFSLSLQPQILEYVGAHKLMGITIGENLLMVPKKSITAVQGIIEK